MKKKLSKKLCSAFLVGTVVTLSIGMFMGNSIESYDASFESSNATVVQAGDTLVDAVNASVTVSWGGPYATNALSYCRVTSSSTNTTLRLSTNGIFVPQSSGSLWYASSYTVDMPIDDDGYPHYCYAAAYSGDSQEAYKALAEAYTPLTFSTTVTRSSSTYIPTSYDQTTTNYVNVWEHGGDSSDTIIGTLFYHGTYYDFELDIPWIGYKTTSFTIDDVEFSVRTGPSKVSVKAGETVSLASVNAFAFRLEN